MPANKTVITVNEDGRVSIYKETWSKGQLVSSSKETTFTIPTYPSPLVWELLITRHVKA